METLKGWIIARPDGQGFCGVKGGVAMFTRDTTRQRCYPRRLTAESVIKAQKIPNVKPLEVERQRPD